MVVVKTFIYSNIFSLSVVRSFCRSSNAISKLESPHHNVVVILVLFMWQWCSSKWYYMYYGSSSSNNTFNTQYYYIICSSICWAVIGILRSGQNRIRTLQSPSLVVIVREDVRNLRLVQPSRQAENLPIRTFWD